ncbi:hypothetical protein WDU94_007702 [Cyamophila willieti]
MFLQTQSNWSDLANLDWIAAILSHCKKEIGLCLSLIVISSLNFVCYHSQDRHVSLVLSQGHVVFRIKYGGEASLEIATTGRYNTGNWTRLEATRYFDRKRKIERGILKVEAESRDGVPTPPPSQDDIPDLLRASYYLGGVSPSFSSPLDLPPSFLGCMANINVAQEGYSPTRGQYWGVQPGCSNKVGVTLGVFCFWIRN